MKIVYKVGDLLDAEEPVIIHGCNAQGAMGSGVAKAVRDRYPRAYSMYRQVFEARGLKLGETIWVECGRHMVVNAITQEFYGDDRKRYVDYDAIRAVMEEIDNHPYFKQTHELSEGKMLAVSRAVAMPMIGAGLAGGDWSIISNIVEESFNFVQPMVYVLDQQTLDRLTAA